MNWLVISFVRLAKMAIDTPDYFGSLKVHRSKESEFIELGLQRFACASQTLNFPAMVSLRHWMTPVKSQLGLGTCTSFGVLASLEYYTAKGLGEIPAEPSINLSEGHVTHVVEKLYGGDCMPGSHIAAVLKLLHQNGCVATAHWAYDGTTVCYPSPPELSTIKRYHWNVDLGRVGRYIWSSENDPVAGYQKDELSRIGLTTDYSPFIKDSIARLKRPVIADVPTFWRVNGTSAGWDYDANGEVVMPTPAQVASWLEAADRSADSVDGWHVICLVGFNENSKRYSFKNSWGTGWGRAGYGTIPYEYINSFTREAVCPEWGVSTGIGVPLGGI